MGIRVVLKSKLPSKQIFYNLLTDRKIGDKEYEQALKICDKFEIRKMKDYNDLYLKCVVYLLGDVFRNRN